MVKNAAFERDPRTAADLLSLDRVGYDPITDTHHGRYHEVYGSIGRYVAEFVAEVVDTPVIDLPPLSGAVAPEALAALVATDSRGGSVTQFGWAGCTVSVASDGEVVVAPGHDD